MANSHSKGETMNISGLFPAKCFVRSHKKLFLLRGMMKIQPKSQKTYLHKHDLVLYTKLHPFYSYTSKDVISLPVFFVRNNVHVYE